MSDAVTDVESLLAKSRRWSDIDPDPDTQRELLAAIDAAAAGDPAQLVSLMGNRLEFGTAGLRGPMGAGTNRINRLMARQTAWGIGQVLLEDHAVQLTEVVPAPAAATSDGPRAPHVLVGYDARHHSDEYARDIAEVLEELGVTCELVDGPNPTPLVSWGLREISASAGIVVTASHNPAADNGIKIFWSDGAQIVAPIDQRIASAIARVETTNPTGSDAPRTVARPGLADDYVAAITSLVSPSDRSSVHSELTDRAGLVIAHTSMHGVGAALVRRCMTVAGFTNLHMVVEQEHPDPDFPTVAFPNPEEPGATDLLLGLARSIDADVAMANDPDTDRLAVGIADGESWRMLGGDELGWLLAAGLIEFRDASVPGLLATTVVSSQMLGRIAESNGIAFFETLTGFKWVSRPGIASPDLDQILAYEEALGYAVGGARDKDGISAALVMADLFTLWKSRGTSAQSILDELAVQHGAHVQHNFSVRIEGADWQERLAATANAVVASPPRRLGGLDVRSVEQPASDVIRLTLSSSDRVVIRPSGTEPKMKCYLEAVEPVAPGETPTSARTRARDRLQLMAEELRVLISG